MSTVAEALSALRAALGECIDTSIRRRAEYSSDASNYRVVPEAVVFPQGTDDVVSAVRLAREHRLPVTARGAGTSIAGNAVGAGLVLDLSGLDRIIEIDAEARTARVQAGVVLADLQRAAAAHGLRFGPDPSSQSRCTIGGMIGNNACGPRAMHWGRTSDNVTALRIVDGTGRIRDLGPSNPVPELEQVADAHLATIRTEFGRYARQGSGFGLEHLLPENGRDAAKAFVGTEGACGVILEATVRLVPIPTATALAVLGYDDITLAADDVPALLPLRPIAIESLDAQLVEVVRRAGGDIPPLPGGRAWLFVETAGEAPATALAEAERIAGASSAIDVAVLPAGADATRLWGIRADGVGLAGRTAEGAPAWAGWEDASVPPEHLGDYLRAFEALKAEHGVSGLSYGHFGDGCVHTRIDYPIADDPDGFARFISAAAELVLERGGSPSGEHGDGRARGDLLQRMYSADALRAFAAFRAVFDPDGILNPGIVVDPAPISADLRLPGVRPLPTIGFAFAHDGGDLGAAAHRCTGVGKCRASHANAAGFMCPSFRATGDERNTTRARARVLQEAVNGTLVDGIRSPALADSLDLCLSCKACSSDCPAEVDIATVKSEVLHQKYRGRIRPLSHYTFGRLPQWLRIAGIAPWALDAVQSVPGIRRLLMRLIGADPRRSLPRLPARSLQRRWRGRGGVDRPDVLIWADSFTDRISPEVGEAAAAVLEDAGYRVGLVPPGVCCGLTWITTGQLDGARRRLRAGLDILEPSLAAGIPIIGLEPSCTAVLRKDVLELLPDDPRARQAAASVRTLAEFLTDPAAPHAASWRPPDLSGTRIIAQPHCHQHAVLGFSADAELLRRSGAEVDTLDGCCGMAGNFGMEAGHYELSASIARLALAPAVDSDADAVLLADGLSCRTQASDLMARDSVHLAELIRPPRGVA
ncbi:FAD-binding oxidoreductase [Microbacterium sp. M28]|uniref:FAD-binding and (Fe-S)-binding domain-containing protein n=1 Tax=Microbacterium sp. M28 TaxID=2962064 RepID=UPI0021F3D680|nr:FAD-binding and (Fe-S)-binding domain-containing protein [Microbacterium sp. M28]UYO97113.1 FAD-binding oxidoreductase [Microbacterium sp. M28]